MPVSVVSQLELIILKEIVKTNDGIVPEHKDLKNLRQASRFHVRYAIWCKEAFPFIALKTLQTRAIKS